MYKLVEKIIALALSNHILVLFLTTILAVVGVYCWLNTQIEAYPDVSNTRIHILAQWPGRSSEEIEKFVTLPIMTVMNTLPRKTTVRSTSLFGLSSVTVVFEDGVDDFFAQQYASNKLQELNLPENVDVWLEPPHGATGEIFRYRIVSDLHIRETAAINEWTVVRELVSVPGVAAITTFGGEEKIFEIQIEPSKLVNYRISPLQVFEAVQRSNANFGGDIIQKGEQAFVVRGIGLLKSIEDIEDILIETKINPSNNLRDIKLNTPIRIKDVATVAISSKPRLGQVGFNEENDIVQGIIIMLRNENPSEVIKGIKAKIDELNNGILPPNVQVVPILDRSKLVNTTVRTVLTNLLEGVILVSLVVFLFLFNWRTTIIVASVMPLAFLFGVIMLYIQDMPVNLISLGALDFGLLLEGTVVIVEVIFVAFAMKTAQFGNERFATMAKDGLIKKAAATVGSKIFFAMIILLVAFIPILSFQKVEGKMFHPLAYTYMFCLLGSLILSLTYVPVMCKLLLRKPIKERPNAITKFCTGNLYKFYEFASQHKRATVVVFCCLLVICGVRFMFWGTEFIPKMNEGAIYIRATLPNSVNLDRSVQLTQEMKRKIMAFDEVEFVLTQTGRPNDGTDPTGFFNIEFHAELKPRKEWKRKIKQDDLLVEMEAALRIYPGIDFAFSQPIQDHVEEYVSGVKASLLIKIFGSDLEELEKLADKTATVIKDVEGVEDVSVFRSIGLPELQIELNASSMSRYNVSVTDVRTLIEMAVAGKSASTFYDGERTFDIMLRFREEYRNDVNKISNILVPTLDGGQVLLREIADIGFVTGPTFIYREGNSRYVAVGFSVRGRDLGSTIRDAQKIVNEKVKLNHSNKIVWAGEFESQQRATSRLKMVIPAVILLVLFLLYMNFGNVKDTLVAASAMPYAFIAGFLSLWITGTTFGISAGIGFIILFGITAIDSILLIGLMKRNFIRTKDLIFSINDAVRWRVRPVLMIALMGSMGLLPASLSSGMGSEVQKPLAIMIVGGMMFLMLLSFTVLPQIFYYAYRKEDVERGESFN